MEKSEVNVDLAFSGKASLKVARVRVGVVIKSVP